VNTLQFHSVHSLCPWCQISVIGCVLSPLSLAVLSPLSLSSGRIYNANHCTVLATEIALLSKLQTIMQT
jgi:hypothetical protein